MGKVTGMVSMNSFRLKAFLSLICIVLCTWHIGFYHGCSWENHLLYSFFHVNGFHLAINLLVLWQIKGRISPVKAFAVAVAASYLPMFVTEPTMGLSGFLFAVFGVMWGRTGRWKDAIRKAGPFILFTMLLNNVNGCLHLYCFVIGYLMEWFIIYIERKRSA